MLLFVSVWAWIQWKYRLPSELYVRENFAAHAPDYAQLALLLHGDTTAQYVDEEGQVDIDGFKSRLVPEYRILMHRLGAKAAIAHEDGSIEFELGGYGGAIMSDSYAGIRYSPKGIHTGTSIGYVPTVVSSIADADLPKENGAVATGLYVIPIAPGWYVYRFEYQE